MAELARVSKLLGTETVSKDEFNRHANFTDYAVRKAFGSWHAAMKAAGLSTNALGKRYTAEDCFENLLMVWTHHGRAPLYEDMKKPPSVVGPKAYILRFGTWTKALQHFINRVESDVPLDSRIREANQIQAPVAEISLPESDRREIRLGLRYSVLKRDRFRCLICGRSPATHLGLVLHIDHIVPVAGGGKTTLENLRSLCQGCNLDKGAKNEGA